MRDIGPLKQYYLKQFANKFYQKFPDELDENSFYRCNLLAEIRAYIKSILPEGMFKYTIFDFNGIYKEIQVIPQKIVIDARDSICKYCWGRTWQELKNHFQKDELIRKHMMHHSVMMQRLQKGSNLIIHGMPIGHPMGRTLLASIIMKEAIKLRAYPGQRGQNYEWIDFSALKYAITNNPEGVVDCSYCSWLVVDNIYQPNYASVQQKTYVSEVIDSFFIGRLNNNLPTIFVFKFDIRQQSFNIEKEMGTGIAKIINSPSTYIISLSEELKVD